MISRYRLLATVLVTLIGPSTSASAENIVAKLPADALRYLSQGQQRKSFAREIADLVLRVEPKRSKAESTSLAKVEAAIRFVQVDHRAGAISDLLKYDLNNDRTVTEAEVEEVVRYYVATRWDWRDKRDPAQPIREYFIRRFDADQDHSVTLSEIRSFDWAASPAGYFDAARAMFAFDPNGDGVLEKTEITAIADHAFDEVDEDHDGKINSAEAQKIPHGN